MSKEYSGNKSLYQKLLGDAYEDLAPNLHAFHRAQTNTRALGQFKVTRDEGLLNKLFGKIADIPQSFEAAKAELIVTPFANNEVWSRWLDNKRVISKQMDGRRAIGRTV